MKLTTITVLLCLSADIVLGAEKTLQLFGTQGVNTSLSAKQYYAYYRDQSSHPQDVLPFGEQIVAARLTFPSLQIQGVPTTAQDGATGTIFIGIIDQACGGSRGGNVLWGDGGETFYNSVQQNEFLTQYDADGSPFLYSHLDTIVVQKGDWSWWTNPRQYTYEFTREQAAILTQYLCNCEPGHLGAWGFTIDPDIYMVINGVATLTFTTGPGNTAPVADAGEDQLVDGVGTVVTLSATGSYDEEGDTLSYSWFLLAKPEDSVVTLVGGNTENATFMPDAVGDYVIRLTVSDGQATTSDDVKVSFSNVKPVANGGENQAVFVGNTVIVDGSASSDANGDVLTYSWSLMKPSGSQAELSESNQAQAYFVADVAGTYTLTLLVNDGITESDPATVTVVATSAADQVAMLLGAAVEVVNLFPAGSLRTVKLQNALTSKLNATLAQVEAGQYEEALNKLTSDLLPKTDGCGHGGTPDKTDWIITCDEQARLQLLLEDAIRLLASKL